MFIFVMLSFLVITCCENADLSLVCYVCLCFCHFPVWCYGSGMTLEFIDSRSLPSSLVYVCEI